MPSAFGSAQAHTIRLVARSPLADEIGYFLIDREARGLSEYTIIWYRQQLGHLSSFLSANGVIGLESVTPTTLRPFLRDFRQTHNAGGTHGVWRATSALFNWLATEYDLPANPTAKVRAPRVPRQVLEPVNLDHLRAMLAKCPRRTFHGDRDRAAMLFLLDSGCRRGEFLALDVGDVNLSSEARCGAVVIRHGKGGKWRTAFIGAKTRRAVARYLRHRPGVCGGDPLWAGKNGQRLTATALRAILGRRAKRAGVPAPSPHSFRRAFALLSLRAGCDLVSLQRLMGHSDLSVISRYLRQTEDDLRRAHERAGPVDRML